MATWDKPVEGESNRAFAAFVVFRDLERTKRSIDSAYRKQNKTKGRASGGWTNWASQFKWGERAAGYDAHCDAIEEENKKAELSELPRRQALSAILVQADFLRHFKGNSDLIDRMQKLPVEHKITRTGKGAKAKVTHVHPVDAKALASLLKAQVMLAEVLVNGIQARNMADVAAGKPKGLLNVPLPAIDLERLTNEERETVWALAAKAKVPPSETS